MGWDGKVRGSERGKPKKKEGEKKKRQTKEGGGEVRFPQDVCCIWIGNWKQNVSTLQHGRYGYRTATCVNTGKILHTGARAPTETSPSPSSFTSTHEAFHPDSPTGDEQNKTNAAWRVALAQRQTGRSRRGRADARSSKGVTPWKVGPSFCLLSKLW